MKKHIPYLSLYVLHIHMVFLSEATITIQPGKVPSLQALTTKSLFDFKNDPQLKKQLNDQLIQKTISIHSLSFDGLMIEDLDLSDMVLKDINFKGGQFFNVQFRKSDLRGTSFEGCKFAKVDLRDAILYYPHQNASQKEVYKKGFKISHWDNHKDLVELCIKLIKDAKVDQGNSSVQVDEEKRAQADCLNKLFPALGLDLSDNDLRCWDLRYINLQNANLYRANLQKAILAEGVIVPDYPENDRTKLFDEWMSGHSKVQEGYQKLVNAGFNIIEGVPPEVLRQGLESKKNLQNANLYRANLQGAHLTGTNLQQAYLHYANLQGADLTDANLQQAKLHYANLQEANLTNTNLQQANLYNVKLQRAILSEEVVLDYPEDDRTKLFNLWMSGHPKVQEGYQKLVNAGFNIIVGVPPEVLRQGLESKKNLQNADLSYANLQGAHLTGTNLQQADLSGANLQGANLRYTNLQQAHLSSANLQGANLSQADLQNAYLSNTKLQGADLIRTILFGARLSYQYRLPDSFKDEDLPTIYKSCDDPQAKKLLNDILKAKKMDHLID